MMVRFACKGVVGETLVLAEVSVRTAEYTRREKTWLAARIFKRKLLTQVLSSDIILKRLQYEAETSFMVHLRDFSDLITAYSVTWIENAMCSIIPFCFFTFKETCWEPKKMFERLLCLCRACSDAKDTLRYKA